PCGFTTESQSSETAASTLVQVWTMVFGEMLCRVGAHNPLIIRNEDDSD
ncbi:MAG: hypothetical protein ACI957_000502, partial [Verrucomicrobiales bacterium]